ncbi:MAG: heparin lyase I family protein, partial [Candidatus Bathyarchaeota archaeon]
VSLLDYLDQWVHLQIHVKWATDATGEVQAWFNNNLVYSQTDFISDPSGYSQWNSYGNLWGYNTPYPIVTIEHYGPQDAINQEFWVDDIVAATEKVPEDYHVVDR